MNEITQKELSLDEIFFSLRDWSKYLKKKLVLIFVITILSGVVGLVYAFMQKPKFVGDLSFVVEEERGSSTNIGGALGLASQFGFDIGGASGSGIFSGANLIELMKSRRIIEEVLLSPINRDSGDKKSFADYYIDFNQWRHKLTSNGFSEKTIFPANIDRSKFTLRQDSLLGAIYKRVVNENLTVTQNDKKVSIIVIEVKSIDEFFSKLFPETLVEKVSKFYTETKTKKAYSNYVLLQQQADSIREALNSAITGVANSTDRVYNLNPALNINRVPTTKKQVDVQANSAMLVQIIQNLELAKVTLRKEAPLIQLVDKPILPLNRVQVSKKMSLIIGGALGFLLIIAILILRRLYWKQI